MRPIRLTLTAFGPYKNKEVIDFKRLAKNQLFVISGQTGSGKTTIFDGISFALYGTASGEDREDSSLLRSHFANDDVHTSAELIFELNGRTYRILRQLGHVKAGNKSKTGDRYEFYELIQDKEIPMVDRQNVTNINKKVEQLIGLTQDQFKQIVMLPQGEFRKLLTSETENKEEILRRLFQTDRYQQISLHLNERRQQLQETFNEKKQSLDHYIQLIYGTLEAREGSQLFQTLNQEHYNVNQVIDHLTAEINFYKKQLEEKSREVKKANQLYDEKQSEYFKAKQTNELFDELAQKEKQLSQLQEKKDIIKEKKQILQAAILANDLIPLEDKYNERVENEKRRKNMIEQINQTYETVKKQFKIATEEYEKEKNNEPKRDELRKQHEQLLQIQPAVKNLTKDQEKIQKKQRMIKEKVRLIKQIEKKIEEKMMEKTKLQEKIMTYEKETKNYIEQYKKLSDLREKYEQLNEFLQVKTNYETLIKEVEETKQQYEKSKKDYEKKEQVWLNDQAVLLATNLNANEACPVCGSKDHPNKATHHITGVTKETLDRLKHLFEKHYRIYQEKKIAFEREQKELKTIRERIKRFEIDEEQLQAEIKEVIKEGKACKNRVSSIEKKQEALTQLRSQGDTLQKSLDTFIENKQKEVDQKQSLKNKLIKIQTTYEEQLKNVPENLQTLEELNEKIERVEAERNNREETWQLAEKNLQAAQLRMQEVESERTIAYREFGHAKKEKQSAKNEFFIAIEQKQFSSINQYVEAKRTAEEQQILTKEIDDYLYEKKQLQADVKRLKSELKEEEKIDLTKLQEDVEHLKNTYEKTLQKYNDLTSIIKNAEMIYENIKRAYEDVKQQEKDLSILIDLYDVIRGQNEKRISFERYLQIGYLEQIIDATNKRLNELSDGQFMLIRSERQETYGRQSGLALDIYDAYTGQARDVKSLSGGEKFNTSLCLALGMSDVIQSFQGGISIEMMFIDEGFGSLDEEALQKALYTLIDLQQSGRMIGVISHVEQLKSIFPAILEVKKLKEGYSETNFIIK